MELNAFTSADFIRWIEGNLAQHTIEKVVPDETTLEQAYRRAIEAEIINRCCEELKEEAQEQAEEAHVPQTLTEMVRAKLNASPELPWDVVLANIAATRLDED